MLKPIWDAFSRENMLKSVFPKESPQIRARKWLQMKTTIVPLRPTTPKRASANERAIKKGGGGHPPATLCVRAFSRESLDPRPGPGGKPTPQVLTCAGPLPPGQRLEDCFFVKSFEIHCVFLANFDKKCYPKNEERETSPEGHRNHRRPQERRGTG